MARILVAGGTGALGSAVVQQLKLTHHTVRVLSRKAAPTDATVEWAQGDVVTGDGLDPALNGIDIVANFTGDPQNAYAADVEGVGRLAKRANIAGVRHFFHISIVGIEHMDATYYQNKVKAEAGIIASGVPYSIQRLTQFHTLMNYWMSQATPSTEGYTLRVERDVPFQPLDTRDAAAYLLPLLDAPAGRLPDAGGPEVLRMGEIARIYLAARGIQNPVLLDPEKSVFPPTTVDAMRQGVHTVRERSVGRITWAAYVREKLA
jgi:uncharacterized protein YbjT (DUF2867 family)